MLNGFFKKEIDLIFKLNKKSFIVNRYDIADLSVDIYYYSSKIRFYYYKSLQHIEQKVLSKTVAEFSLYVIPSGILSNSDCMITARKNFLRDICIKNNLTPGLDDKNTLLTKCHEDFFYLIDMENRCAIWVINENIEIHAWYRVSPFQHFFQELMSVMNKQIAHAAVVANDDFGLLFTGNSGAGKTTTTLLAIKNGYRYVSEDYCILTNKHNRLTAHSLYNAIKIMEDVNFNLKTLFKHEPICIQTKEKEKKAYFLSQQDTIKIAKNVPIRGILSLKITSDINPSIIKENPQSAIKSLAFSTIQQNPIYANCAIKNFYLYTKSVPLFQFNLSHDFEKNINLLTKLFYELSS